MYSLSKEKQEWLIVGESPCKLHYYTFGRLENRNLTKPIGRLNVINVVIIVSKFQQTISFRRARYFTDYIIMINNNTIFGGRCGSLTRLRLLQILNIVLYRRRNNNRPPRCIMHHTHTNYCMYNYLSYYIIMLRLTFGIV